MIMKTLKTLFAFLMVCTLTSFTSLNDGKGYKIGDIATDFKLENVDGKMDSLSDYKEAKGYIVIFTCNTCPYAQAYEERIVELDKKYAAKGFPVIAIMPNNPKIQSGDNMEAMKSNAKQKGFTFPYLMDEGQKIYSLP